MPVTKQTYVANAPWNVVELADIFRDAFIDAGLMTDWYDSFLNGNCQTRVLRIIYDGAKAFGTTFYWFMFTGETVLVSITTGWDNVAHKPTGVATPAYLDYISLDTSTAVNHMRLKLLNSSVSTTITRYTSQADPNFTYFIARCGGINFNFFFDRAKPVPWINLDKTCYTSMFWTQAYLSGSSGGWRFQRFPMILKRHHIAAQAGGGRYYDQPYFMGYSSGANEPWNYTPAYEAMGTHWYWFAGNNKTDYSPPNNSYPAPGVVLPVYFPDVNPLFTPQTNPVFSNLLISLYSPTVLPSDFGMAGHLTSNAMAIFDRYIVTPNTEEYDIIDVANSSTLQRNVSVLFLARIS